MTEAELRTLTLASALGMIARKEISPVELTQAVLTRIDRLNPEMHALIAVMNDEALKTAQAAELEIAAGHPRSLKGIPLSVKDLYDTKGVKTTAGAKIFANRVPGEDAAAVQKLKEAGAVIVGKANLHEFAFGVTTVNPHYGATKNPRDTERIAGGS